MLRPKQDYLLIKPLERVQSTVLAVVSHEKHCRGVVVACGPGKRDKRGNLKPLDAKPGDTVAFGDGNFDFYPKWHDEKPDGTSDVYRIIQEADIVFIEDKKISEMSDAEMEDGGYVQMTRAPVGRDEIVRQVKKGIANPALLATLPVDDPEYRAI